MDSYLSKFKVAKISKEQALADQIFKYFNKRLSFGRIMKIIFSIGYQATYEIWNDVSRSGASDDPLALFVWKVKRENKKIQWNLLEK